jgi:hypothetical protein
MNVNDILAEIGKKHLKPRLPNHEFVIIAVQSVNGKAEVDYVTTLHSSEAVVIMTDIIKEERLRIQ